MIGLLCLRGLGLRSGIAEQLLWECLGSIHPSCDVDRFFGCDVWQIKELEVAVTPGGVMTSDSCCALVGEELRSVSLHRGCFRPW